MCCVCVCVCVCVCLFVIHTHPPTQVGRQGDRWISLATACGGSQFIEWHDTADPDATRVQDSVREHTAGRGFDTVFYTAYPEIGPEISSEKSSK